MLYHLLHQCCITKNDATPTITFYTHVLHHSKNDATPTITFYTHVLHHSKNDATSDTTL
ncbi:hypothetical protein ACJRDZ_001839 [Staphylococcus aureus]